MFKIKSTNRYDHFVEKITQNKLEKFKIFNIIRFYTFFGRNFLTRKNDDLTRFFFNTNHIFSIKKFHFLTQKKLYLLNFILYEN